jgi:hypothetical protein
MYLSTNPPDGTPSGYTRLKLMIKWSCGKMPGKEVAPQTIHSEARASDHAVLRTIRFLTLRRCATATILILATGTATLGQKGSKSNGEQEVDQVKAGESYSFTLHLDEAPPYSDGRIYYPMSPLVNGASIGSAYSFCASTVPQQKDYECIVTVPKDFVGNRDVTLTTAYIQSPHENFTVYLRETVKFRVLGLPPPIERTEGADVTVNPTQAQLLRRAGTKLQGRIADLKAAVVQLEKPEAGNSPLADLLQKNVEDAVNALQDTEREFEKPLTKKEVLVTSQIFFQDLLLSYKEILTQIKESRHNPSLAAPRFRPVSQRDPAARPEYPLLAQATIHTLERNVLVYNAVAANETLYFDLVVNSNPEGGLISYHLRADPPKLYGDHTNATLKNLTYAVWIVSVAKQGYKSQERDHDPALEPNHVLTFDLQPSKDHQ